MRPYYLGASHLVVGASSVQEFNAGSFESGFVLQRVGTSGTVEITLGTSFGVGTGRVIGNYDNIVCNGPATFYLAASGITQTVSILKSYSAGATPIANLPIAGGLL